MKLISCAALLVCATTVMAKDTMIDCTGLFKNECPSGYKQEWYWSGCKCLRPETALEEQQRQNQYRPDRCFSAVGSCKMFGGDRKIGQKKLDPCDDAIRYCNREKVDEICKFLKDRNKRWQCSDSKNYQNLLQGKPWSPNP